MEEGGTFIGADVWSAGRIARDEIHQYRLYVNHVRIDVADRPVYVNRLRIEPPDPLLFAPGALEQFTHYGTLYGFGPFIDRTSPDRLRDIAAGHPSIRCGVSLAARYGLTAVVLGSSAWEVQSVLAALGEALLELN
jgi:urease accessory protein UreH